MAEKLFIRQFVENHNIVRECLEELKSKGQTNSDEYKALADIAYYIKQIADYISHGNWARPKTRSKLVYWIKSKCDYELTAKAYHTDPRCVRVLVTRADAKLRSLLERPCNLIARGETLEGWIEFCANTGKYDLAKLYGSPVSAFLPERADLDNCTYYALGDCKDEIAFLSVYNSCVVQCKVNALDHNKLAYLIALVDSSDTALYKERCRLLQAMIKI